MAGRPAPDVSWHVNGTRAAQDARHKMVVNESGFHTMLVSDARLGDAGAVRCVAKNRSGVAEFQVHTNADTTRYRWRGWAAGERSQLSQTPESTCRLMIQYF